MFDLLNSIPLIGGVFSYIIATIIVLGTVVTIHEFGHYIVGRWCGIGAEVFSIGFGKVLFSRVDKRGTKWQISAIPLGGYVKFLGDDNAASTQGRVNIDELKSSQYFFTASLWRRALTVLAGPAANFILSICVFSALAFYSGRPEDSAIIGKVIAKKTTQIEIQKGDKILSVEGVSIQTLRDVIVWSNDADAGEITRYTVERDGEVFKKIGPFPRPSYIAGVMPVSAASKAGLKVGDFIISLDGNSIHSFDQLQDAVKLSGIKKVEIIVLRGKKEHIFYITPRVQEIEISPGKIESKVLLGIMSGFAFEPVINKIGIVEAVTAGVNKTWGVITGSVRGLSMMFKGEISPKNLQGPVGIANMAGDVAKTGWLNLIRLIGLLSTAIGFLNLFPLPILDGGHLVQFAYQGICGKPMNERIIQYVSAISLALLLTLMLFSGFNDISRWLQ